MRWQQKIRARGRDFGPDHRKPKVISRPSRLTSTEVDCGGSKAPVTSAVSLGRALEDSGRQCRC
jgi:hypothetical protein